MQLYSLALRNLGRQRRRTLLLGGTIAFGVLVISLLNTLAAGLTSNVQANLLDSTGGQAFFSGRELSPSGRVLSVLRDPAAVEQALAEAGWKVQSSEVRSSSRVGVLFGGASADVTLQGLSPQALSRLSQRLHLVSGSLENLEPGGLVLPSGTAKKMGVEVGDLVLVRTQTISGQENVTDLTVSSLVEDPVALGNPVAYAGLETVNGLLAIPSGGGQTLAVTWADSPAPDSQTLYRGLTPLLSLAPVSRANDGLAGLAASLRSGAGPGSGGAWEGVQITIRTLDEVMAPLLGLVDTLRAVNLGVLGLMLVVILVGISNTFRMILLERTREVGTLRALGMHRREVLGLFLLEAVFLALGGIVLGTLASWLISAGIGLISWTPFVGTLGGIFFRGGRLAMNFPWAEGGLVLLIVAGICGLAAWGPSRAAARLEPAEALRTQN